MKFARIKGQKVFILSGQIFFATNLKEKWPFNKRTDHNKLFYWKGWFPLIVEIFAKLAACFLHQQT